MKMLFIVFAVACSVPPHETPAPTSPPHRPASPVPHEASEHSELEALPHLDGATTCGQAQTCCRAFVAAMPNVVAGSACAETAEVAGRDDADERCERMMTGWRIALEHHPEAEPPPACGGS